VLCTPYTEYHKVVRETPQGGGGYALLEGCAGMRRGWEGDGKAQKIVRMRWGVRSGLMSV